MAFVLTVLYVALSLLSPSVLPQPIWSLHVNIILGIATILALLPLLGRPRLNALPDMYFVVGLILAAAVSIVPVGMSLVPGKLMGYLPILIVFYFVAIACRSLGQIKVLTWVLVGVAFFIFLQGWMAYQAHNFTSPYLLPEGRGGSLIYRFQGLGVLSDPNDTAQLFVTLIPLLFLRWKKGSPLPNFVLTIVPMLVLATALYFTHSRGGALALVAVCLFGFKDKLGLVPSSVLAVCLFAGLMAINISGGRGISNDDGSRVAFWGAGLEIFKAHPLIGVGIGRFPEYNGGLTAHNSYVVCLAELGLFGYFCWMGTIVLSLTGLSQIARRGDGGKGKTEKRGVAPPPHMRWRPALEGSHAVSTGIPMRAAALASPGFASATYTEPAPVSWAPPSVRFGGEELKTTNAQDDADLIRTAKVLRVAFVGMLASGYFISRAFSMVFYVLIGMSAAVRLLYLERHPEESIDRKKMLKQVLMVIVGSVTFIYLFVRIRGIH